jgi:spore coat polysaccharide biosynthesis predicted glycosyltransferase SpsG
VAVVAGGVTLYEACALATPVVTLAVVDAQRITTAACAARGAAIDASDPDPGAAVARAADAVRALLDRPDARLCLGMAAGRLVDGLGTARVVAHLRALVLASSPGKATHAA